ncbi:hypothetical protein Bca52824_046682 [Brassica carinata]|uniref:Uncharacterized protein n=1 Tax=Brassica carinata TaxID=52824 RepID=A0A8X7RD94_BRACI|nr:hypothetical protein Bca52824_046682 [Brassica carinata]
MSAWWSSPSLLCYQLAVASHLRLGSSSSLSTQSWLVVVIEFIFRPAYELRGEAHAEIRALRLSERQREKAVEELTNELTKLEEKLKLTESLLQGKNLEIGKINE